MGKAPKRRYKQLVASGDRVSLRQAQSELVQRVHERSDDFAATAALSLVNKALAIVGWTDPFSWKHRRKP
jgi:putative ribosome biogenesis GTPase RsgA